MRLRLAKTPRAFAFWASHVPPPCPSASVSPVCVCVRACVRVCVCACVRVCVTRAALDCLSFLSSFVFRLSLKVFVEAVKRNWLALGLARKQQGSSRETAFGGRDTFKRLWPDIESKVHASSSEALHLSTHKLVQDVSEVNRSAIDAIAAAMSKLSSICKVLVCPAPPWFPCPCLLESGKRVRRSVAKEPGLQQCSLALTRPHSLLCPRSNPVHSSPRCGVSHCSCVSSPAPAQRRSKQRLSVSRAANPSSTQQSTANWARRRQQRPESFCSTGQ